MNSIVLWLDKNHAKLILFSREKMERKSVKNMCQGAEPTQDFFREIVSIIKDSDRILLLGPCVAKHHFRNHLSEHFPNLDRRVLAVIGVDHPSDETIAQIAREYFSLATA